MLPTSLSFISLPSLKVYWLRAVQRRQQTKKQNFFFEELLAVSKSGSKEDQLIFEGKNKQKIFLKRKNLEKIIILGMQNEFKNILNCHNNNGIFFLLKKRSA